MKMHRGLPVHVSQCVSINCGMQVMSFSCHLQTSRDLSRDPTNPGEIACWLSSSREHSAHRTQGQNMLSLVPRAVRSSRPWEEAYEAAVLHHLCRDRGDRLAARCVWASGFENLSDSCTAPNFIRSRRPRVAGTPLGSSGRAPWRSSG